MEKNREGRKEHKLRVRLRVRQTLGPTPITITITAPLYIFPHPCAWNSRERGFAPPDAAVRSAQRGHVPLGL
jgi:hypothetical protein